MPFLPMRSVAMPTHSRRPGNRTRAKITQSPGEGRLPIVTEMVVTAERQFKPSRNAFESTQPEVPQDGKDDDHGTHQPDQSVHDRAPLNMTLEIDTEPETGLR